MKIDLSAELNRARESAWGLRKLNLALSLGIPFNRPHGIKIHKVEADAVVVILPYRRRNFNHLKGLHACALATAAEFCSGLAILRRANPSEYRLIMKRIEIEYHYQARMDAYARYELTEARFDELVRKPLLTDPAVLVTCEVPVHDAAQNHLCTARTIWQVKAWKEVRTK